MWEKYQAELSSDKLKIFQIPDLIVSEINFSGNPVQAGKAYNILISVKNISSSMNKHSPPYHLTVQMFLNEVVLKLFDDYPVPEIPSNTGKVICKR